MNWLNKLLNIRPAEWPRLLFLSIILILSNVGTNWGMNVAYAAFLKQAGLKTGLETLIWVLFLSSVLSIPALAIYTAFVDRIDNNRLFAYIIIAGGLIIILSLVLLNMGFPALAFPLLYVLSLAWLAIFNPHFFTYINELYDIQSAKRMLPLILAAGRIGAALAGFMLKFLSTRFDAQSIIWFWLFNDIAVVGLILAMPFFIKEKSSGDIVTIMPTDTAANKGGTSYFSSLQEGWAFTLQSQFLRWMAIGTLILAALLTLLEYYVNKIMIASPQFESSADYAGFLGLLDGISNLVALVILLFGISRMTRAWGIGNTSLVFSISNLFISGALVTFPSIITGSFAHLNRKGLRFSLQAPIDALFYNAIPLRIKGRARAFVGGFVSPFGAIIGVLLLLAELWYGSIIPWLVPGVIALLALAYLISTFVIRYQYTQALVKMLEEEDYSFLLSEEASELVVADPATLQRLQKKLEESSTHEMRVFMTQLIAQVGGTESLSILIPVIKSANEARTRASMLNVVTAAGLRGDKMRELYTGFLSDSDAQVRQVAGAGLEQLLGTKDTWLRQQWLNMINDTNAGVSLYALQSLAKTGEFYKFKSAVQKLDELLNGNSSEDKKNALRILGVIAQPKSMEQLLAFLSDKNDQLRIAAFLELEKFPLPLANILDAKILKVVKKLQHDPVARVRQSVLNVIGKYKNKEDHHLLVSALGDKNPQVRAAAVDLLVASGKTAVPILQTEINSSDPQTHKMAIAALSRINPRQFASLIESTVSDTLNNIYQNISLEQAVMPYEKYRSARVLLATLRERSRELIDEILYLLSAVHSPQVLRVVGESLHSDSPATRNLALEALESLTSPQTAALIASLFEPTMAPSQLMQLGQGSWHIEQLDTIQTLKKLATQTEDRILLLLVLHVMGDIGAGLSNADIDPITNASNLRSTIELQPEHQAAPDVLIGQIKSLLENALSNPDLLVQQAAQEMLQKITGMPAQENQTGKDGEHLPQLSVTERIIILKEVPFFRNISISQLETLASVCEEKIYEKNALIFNVGDPGGILYIVADGQVKIEQEKRTGSAHLATIDNYSYFGEMTFFDNSLQSNRAVTTKNSMVLQMHRAPIIAIAMQNSDLALELINVLSQRMRETSDRLAEAAPSRPRELHKLFDQFDQ